MDKATQTNEMKTNETTGSAENAAQDQNAKASGNNAEKTFTQDDVNRIVSERLAREREKAVEAAKQPSEAEVRESDLSKRENKMSCKEYIFDNNYSEKLLDLFPTDNFEEFKKKVEQLTEAFPGLKLYRYSGTVTSSAIRLNGSAGHEQNGSYQGKHDRLADIFKK